MAHLNESLAYVAITGDKKFLHMNTRIKLLEYTFVSNGLRVYEVNDAGLAKAITSKTWAAHQFLTAQGFKLNSDRRHSPRFISYSALDLSETKSGKPFARAAFISKGGRVYMDMPDDSTGSGWRMQFIDR